MTQVCTNKKQSVRLMRAGVPYLYADMYIARNEFGETMFFHSLSGGALPIGKHQKDGYTITCTLSFSLSKLWQMVHELDSTYEFPTELSAEELIEALVKTLEYRYTHT